MTNAFGYVLVERDGVAKARTAGMGRCSEKADVGRMSTIDIGMGDSAKNGEVVAMGFERLQVRRKGVIRPRIFWEEMFGEESQVVADAEYALRGWGGISGRKCRAHGLEHGEGKACADSANEAAAR